jgi:hypothetical protein
MEILIEEIVSKKIDKWIDDGNSFLPGETLVTRPLT